jgi:serine O-acetyltransferase
MALFDDVYRDLHRRFLMGARPADLFLDPAFYLVMSYRLGRAIRSLPRALAIPLLLVHRPIDLAIQVVTGSELPAQADLGGGLHVSHAGGIILAPEAHLGRDCNLAHGVTIGVGGRGDDRGVPFVCDRVYFGPGAKLFGNIRIGNDVAIGANAVVREDVPDGAVVAGIPARVVSMNGSQEFVVKGRRRPPLGRLLRELFGGRLALRMAG